jgi:MazG family protein
MATNLDHFITTIARLRGPDGCPWDQEQTHRTLARYLLEEAYEVLEAIHSNDPAKLQEELGDLLLQIVLNAQVAKDEGHFDIQDVADGINKKMIKRHPHVFGDTKVDNAKQVLMQWEELKDRERQEKRGDSTETHSAMDNIPKAMPALLQALKVSEKAVQQGFEWRNEGEVWAKLESELDELKEAISNPDMDHPEKQHEAKEEVELELGDVLFCLVNVARWHTLNPEESLIKAIEKFKLRFRTMEQLSSNELKDLSKEELYELWQKSKAHLAETACQKKQ